MDTEGYGKSFPGDVFVRWEGDYRFVEGDLVVVTGAVAEPLTFETAIGSQRTIPAFYGSEIIDHLQLRATRQIIEATKQVEYLADYEARTADALQEIQSCTSEFESALTYGPYKVVDLAINYFAGPVPDDLDANTAPNILLEGSYTRIKNGETQYWQFTAYWIGWDCEFWDQQYTEVMRPTREPNAPQPTYTPRPVPGR